MSQLQQPPEPVKDASAWKSYWEKDSFWAGSPIWRINADLFLKKSQKLLRLNPHDHVLDVGCGPGLIAARLAPLVESITAMDYSTSMVELAEENCAEFPNVFPIHTSQDFETYGPFTLVIAVSVAQYFSSFEEIEKWIFRIKDASDPGARLLIADLPIKRNIFGAAYDFACSAFASILGGYSKEFFETSFRLLHRAHPYRKISAQNPSLLFTHEWCTSLIKKHNFNATVITESLSVCSNRPSLLIQF